jgi:subtilisin family serine protease
MDIRRSLHAPTALGAVMLIAGLAACGGGGGGATPSYVPTAGPSGIVTPTPGPTSTATAKATPTPTPAPTSSSGVAANAVCTSVAKPAACTYSIASNPAGIQVTLNGASIGVTPLSTTPPYAAAAQTLAFANSTYTVAIDQTGSSARTVFYNAVMDTGTQTMAGNQSVARNAASASRSSSEDGMTTRGLERFDHSRAIATRGVYVKYDASKLTQSIGQLEGRVGALRGVDVLSSVAAIRGRVVSVAPGVDVRTLASALLQQPGVIGVYPLHYRVPTSVSRVIPNDAEFGYNAYQWDMDMIQATYAWSLTQGGQAKIAIIDTGVDLQHPDLPSSKVVYQESDVNGVTSTATGAAQDTNGHGTNVAGIAAANTNDGIGFAGVGYNAKLYAFRIFPPATANNDEQTADTGDEATAIAHAVAQGVDVINLSLGSSQYDPSSGIGFDQGEHDAVEAAIAAGVTVVAAAGNGDANNIALATVDFPAAYDGVISVGAESIVDNNIGSWSPTTGFANIAESVATYSNYGPGLGVVAPGGDTAAAGNSSSSDNLHWIVNDSTTTANDANDTCTPATLPSVCGEKFQGTSQATPHVTGTVALVQSALREHGLQPLTPAAMLQLIDGTADNINSPYQGHGRLNTLRAVASAIGVTLVGTVAPTPPPSSPAQFVAFAYANSGASPAKPAIADVTYPNGVPVSSAGTFRIADVDPSKTTGPFKIAVWLDANGDGIVDAGDQFGVSSVTCTANAACHPSAITVTTLTSSGALP